MISGEETLQTILSRTPQGRAILAKLQGEDGRYLGKFLPGLMKPLKKIGKFTSKITGTIAKVAAGVFGIPPGAIDALAKIDPTAHTALLDKLSQVKTADVKKAIATQTAKQPPGTQPKAAFPITPLYIGIGAAGIAGIIIVLIATKKRKRG